jgi:sulfur-oxidizing protein SoxZ
MAKPRIKVPGSVKKGEVFEVKTLIKHKMETGQRKDKKTGKKIPRDIINKFTAEYNGAMVFEADMHPAVSANPYLAFFVRAEKSGPLVMKWTDDQGKTIEATSTINVTA